MPRAAQILLIVLLLGALGFGVIQFNEARRLRAELAGLGEERDRLLEKARRNAVPGPMPRVGIDGGGPTPLNAPTNGVEATGPGMVSAASPANVVRGPGGRFNAMNSPEVQQLMAIQQKAGLDGRYAALFRQLNLSPAALEQLKHLLVEKQAVVGDVLAAARSQGMGGRENRDDIRVLVESTQAEVEESIRAALGESAYAQYRNFETTLPQRAVVDQLEQRLSYSGAPLGDAQAEQLVQILAATAPAGNVGGRNAVMMPFVAASPRRAVTAVAGGGVRITDDAVAQARGVLSAQQLTALQSLQQEQQAAAGLMEQMRANRQNMQPATVVPLDPGGG